MAQSAVYLPNRWIELSEPLLRVDLLKAAYHRFGNWAHATGVICVVIADILHPLHHFTTWLFLIALATCVGLIAALGLKKIREECAVAGLIFAIVILVLSGGMWTAQRLSGGQPEGAIASKIPSIESLQKALNIVGSDIAVIRNDIGDVKKQQAEQNAKLDELVRMAKHNKNALDSIKLRLRKRSKKKPTNPSCYANGLAGWQVTIPGLGPCTTMPN